MHRLKQKIKPIFIIIQYSTMASSKESPMEVDTQESLNNIQENKLLDKNTQDTSQDTVASSQVELTLEVFKLNNILIQFIGYFK